MKGNDGAKECDEQCGRAEADGVAGDFDGARGDEDCDREHAGHDGHGK